MPSPLPSNGLRPGRLPRSRRVLLLIDFINPFGFPGADKLAGPAVEAARLACALKERLAREGVVAIYANDNYGVWQSDFHSRSSPRRWNCCWQRCRPTARRPSRPRPKRPA